MMKQISFFLFISTINCLSYYDITLTPEIFTPSRSIDCFTSSHLGGGFFCELTKVISNLIYYEKDGIRSIHVDWSNEFFPFKDKPFENGWNLYFEPIKINTAFMDTSEPSIRVGNCFSHELHDQLCIAHWTMYDRYLPYRIFAHNTFHKYITIKKEILEKVNTFYNSNMKNNICIGIHVRHASAHIQESPGGHPSLQDYFAEIDAILNLHIKKNVKIFLASDSHFIISEFKKRYSKLLLFIDTYRAPFNQDPVLIYEKSEYWIKHPQEWHKHKPGYPGGLGALLDCLLLSKCDYFVHISSNLSNFVTFFNPYIKSIYLPKNIRFKPCRYAGNNNIRNPYLNPL